MRFVDGSPRFAHDPHPRRERPIEPIERILDLAGHLDRHLVEALRAFGPWTYLVLFALAFGETILVIAPFLPGPSLIFASGAIAGRPDPALDVGILYIVFWVAGVLGDVTSYAVGKRFGPAFQRRFRGPDATSNYARTESFFDRHSGKTVLLARFVPVVRTMAPLVAGARGMPFRRFLAFVVTGGALCVAIYLLTGYFFGSIPAVRANFWLVLTTIAIASIVPAAIEWMRFRRERAAGPQPPR